MRQNIRIFSVKEYFLDPMMCRYRIERQSDLVELSLWKLPSQTVIDNLKIRLRDLRGFFYPDIGKFSSLECNRFQLFSLLLIVHTSEDNLIPVHARQLQRRLLYCPVFVSILPEHPVDGTVQFCKGRIPVSDVGLPDAYKIPSFVLHQAQDIMLCRVHALSRSG